MLKINDLSLAYGGRTVFEGLNLQVEPGQVVGILGQNGAGKTTLLRAVLGEIHPEAGSVYLRDGVKISYLPQHGRFPRSAQIRGRDVVYLGLEGQRLGCWSGRGARALVHDALAAVGALAYADTPISLLSGGELQRLRIASALVGQPDLLLVDEPLASLDIKHQTDIVRLFAAIKEQGTAILLVTHELNPVEKLLDQVVYIALGRAAVGTVSEVMTSESLSRLYGEKVQVLQLGGKFFVVSGEGDPLEISRQKGGFVEEALHGHHHAGHFESAEDPHNHKEAGH